MRLVDYQFVEGQHGAGVNEGASVEGGVDDAVGAEQ